MISFVNSISQYFGVSNWLVWLILVIAIVYTYGTWTYSTFKRMGIPGPTPVPILGNFLSLLQDGFRLDLKLLKKFGPVYGYYEGVIPVLVVAEPEYIKQICVKNFDHFPDHRNQDNTNKGLQKSILGVNGDEWKTIRNTISPTFSGGKMKKVMLRIFVTTKTSCQRSPQMSQAVNECAERLSCNLGKFADNGEMCEIRQ